MKHRKWLAGILSVVLALSATGMSGCGFTPLWMLPFLMLGEESSTSSSSEDIYSESGNEDEDTGDGQSTESADVDDWYAEAENTEGNGTKTEGFDEFLEEQALSIISTDYISVHQYYGDDYEAAGLEKPEPTFGTISWSDFADEAASDLEILSELRSYDYDALSEEQQVRYTIFERVLEDDYVACSHPDFQMYFDGSSDFISSIINSLDNFIFYNEEDFSDFIQLVQSIPDCLDSVISVTEKQAEDGYFINDTELENVCGEIETFCDKGEDCSVISYFNDSIDTFEGISEEDKTNLKTELKDAVLQQMIPAFQDTEDALQEMQGSRDGGDAMCSLQDGESYYEVLLRNALGYDADMNDVADMLRDETEEIVAELLILEQGMTEEEFEEEPDLNDAQEIMNYLESHMEDYPEGPEVSYTFSYMESDQETSNILAYYVTPTLTDPTSNNVIRLSSDADDILSLYSTLAHEGMPGHMYQITREMTEDPSLFSCLFSCSGYTEGWAEYASYEAMLEAPMSENACTYQALADELNYVLCALADIEVNGMGMQADDLENELIQLGFTDDFSSSMATALYDSVTAAAGVYLSYGVGMTVILNLREEAEDEQGSQFTALAFNTAVLDEGSIPLDILQDHIEAWIIDGAYSSAA